MGRVAWVQLVIAAGLMLATLPGRTQGLGLVTESLLKDLRIERTHFANLNLWATLIGAGFCFPAGWALDRWGLRWLTGVTTGLLGLVVWQFSGLVAGGAFFFACLLATRALGQSALSVASLTAVGKWFPHRVGRAMGVYSVLISVFFAVAFVAVGASVRRDGWRTAWRQLAVAEVGVMAPLVLLCLREPGRFPGAGQLAESAPDPSTPGAKDGADSGGVAADFSLSQALGTRAFWLFAAVAAVFNLVSSGLGLFNEAVLAERGFEAPVFHLFLGVTTLLSLVGQLACGWLIGRWSFPALTVASAGLYAAGLALIPFVHTQAQLWVPAVLLGGAGGMIIVIFFSVWSAVFGRRHLGRIQGAAQMLTVVASAVGPVLFAWCFERTHSYAPLLLGLAGAVLALALATLTMRAPAVPT